MSQIISSCNFPAHRNNLIDTARSGLDTIKLHARTNKIALIALTAISTLVYTASIVFIAVINPPLIVIGIAGLVGAVALVLLLKITVKKYKPIRQFKLYDAKIRKTINLLNSQKQKLTTPQFNDHIHHINRIVSDYNTYQNALLKSKIYLTTRSINNNIALLKTLEDPTPPSYDPAPMYTLFRELNFNDAPIEAFAECFEILERTQHSAAIDYIAEQLSKQTSFLNNIDRIPLIFHRTLVIRGNRAATVLAPIISQFKFTSPNFKYSLYSEYIINSRNSSKSLPNAIIFPDLSNITPDKRLQYYSRLLRCPPSAKVMANNPDRLNLSGTTTNERLQFYRVLCEHRLNAKAMNQLDWTGTSADERLEFCLYFINNIRLPNKDNAIGLAQHIDKIDLSGTSAAQRLNLYRAILNQGGPDAAEWLSKHLTHLDLEFATADDRFSFYHDVLSQSRYKDFSGLDVYGMTPQQRLTLYKLYPHSILLDNLMNLDFDDMHENEVLKLYKGIALSCPGENNLRLLRQSLNANPILQDNFDKSMASIPHRDYIKLLETANLSSSQWLKIALLVCDSPDARSSRKKVANDMLNKILPNILTKLSEQDLLTLFDPDQTNLTPVLSGNETHNFFGLDKISVLKHLYIERNSPAISRFNRRANTNSSTELEPFLKMLTEKTGDIEGCYLTQDEISILLKMIDDDPKLQLLIPIIETKQKEIAAKKELDTFRAKPQKSENYSSDEFSIYMHWVCYTAATLSILPETLVQKFHAQKDQETQAKLLADISSQVLNETSACCILDDRQYCKMNNYVRRVWSMQTQPQSQRPNEAISQHPLTLTSTT